MNAFTTLIFIEALAINAEIEGMKALNAQRNILGMSMAYAEDAFYAKAVELRRLYNQLHEARANGQAE